MPSSDFMYILKTEMQFCAFLLIFDLENLIMTHHSPNNSRKHAYYITLQTIYSGISTK